MPRGKTVQNRVGFSAGLITENNPLNQIPNSLQDVKNMVLSRNGDIYRRFGIEQEAGGANVSTGIGPATAPDRRRIAVTEFYWDNPGNDLSKAFTVVQFGTTLRFFDSATTAPSANAGNGGVLYDMQSEFDETMTGQFPVQFAAISGYLVVVCKEFSTPHYVRYDVSEDSFTAGIVTINVRDVWGVEDGLAVDETPITLSQRHYYNLLNQGWNELDTTEAITTEDDGDSKPVRGQTQFTANRRNLPTESVSRISQVFTDRGTYPSNAEIQSLYDADPDVLIRTNTTPAPKGRFIINAFTRGASRVDKSDLDLADPTTEDLANDSETNSITVLKTFADRVFYTGIDSKILEGDLESPDYSSTLFFTRLIRSDQDLGKCYQEADPTSEDFNELVASDGGFINITEANNIVAMETLGSYLLVFADNGIWSITGPDGVFKANDYSVTKISNTGALNSSSIVRVRNTILFWSNEGVYRIQPQEVGQALSVNSLSETTIQSFYNDIPSVGKLYAKGTFDSVEQRVRWLYNDLATYDGILDRQQYNKELIYDAVLDAWYMNDFNDTQRIMGYIQVSPYIAATDVQDVYYNGDNVEYNGDQVTYTTQGRSSQLSTTKYLTSTDESFGLTELVVTVSTLSNTTFRDWEGETEEADAEALVVTAWENAGDVTRRKDIEYLYMFFKRTELSSDMNGNPNNQSGCLLRTRWDFGDSANGGKWSRQYQAYRYKRLLTITPGDPIDYGQSVVVTKNKVRGSGKVLAFEMQSEENKDMYIHGWSVTLLGNQNN